MKKILFIFIMIFILVSCGNKDIIGEKNNENIKKEIVNEEEKKIEKEIIEKEITKKEITKKDGIIKVDNKENIEKQYKLEKKQIEENIRKDNEKYEIKNTLKVSFSNKGVEYCVEKYGEDSYNYSNCLLLNIIYKDDLNCENVIKQYGKEEDEYGNKKFTYELEECNELINNMKLFLELEKGRILFNSINNSIFGEINKNIFINLLQEKDNMGLGNSDSETASVNSLLK